MKKKEKEIVEIKEAPVEEYYVMKIGETLEDVAKKFKLDVEKLKELNGEVFGTNQIKLK